AWCETNDVGYVLGLARNKRLQQALGKEMEEARLACERTGETARCFRDFRYRTRKSWSCERRVIGKAEYLPGKANPRFVITNLSTRDADAQHLYEDLYCARGEMEKFIGNEFSRKPRRCEAQGCAEQNRIKEQQLGLFADRTSSATLRANQLRLYFSSFAYVLLHGLRRLGLTGTAFAKAQSTTIRLKLLKIGARLHLTVRKVWLSFSEASPY
ncbi:transposase, partial [Thiolapillus sp.]